MRILRERNARNSRAVVHRRSLCNLYEPLQGGVDAYIQVIAATNRSSLPTSETLLISLGVGWTRGAAEQGKGGGGTRPIFDVRCVLR